MSNKDTTRQIAAAMAELQEAFPEMRFGQLVLTVAQRVAGPVAEAAYDVTDEDFLKSAQELLNQHRSDIQSPPAGPRVKRAG